MRGRTKTPFAEEAWGNDAAALRATAAARLKADWLQWWWCKRYNRPLKDPLLQEYTVEELQIEYFMDWIEKDPTAAYPRGANVAFKTGDKYIDDIEKALADGEEPDLDAGLDPDMLKRVKAFSKRQAEKHYPELRDQTPPEQQDLPEDMEDLEGFSDNYSED